MRKDLGRSKTASDRLGRFNEQLELERIREQLDLIFWATRETLRLTLFAAFTVYTVASLMRGEVWILEEIQHWTDIGLK